MSAEEQPTTASYGVSDANTFATTGHNLINKKCTSEQGRCLAYLTIKHMVRTQGPNFHKGVSLGLNAWTSIARDLNVMGIEKTPEQWKKCFSAAKYFAHMRFKEKYAANPSVRVDWNEIEIRDLLYLQDLRLKGYPDMPDPDVLIRAFDNRQMYLSDYQPTQKANFTQPRDFINENKSSYCNNFNDFTQFSVPQHQQHDLSLGDDVQIKSELDDCNFEAADDFHQHLQQIVEAHHQQEYTSKSNTSHQGTQNFPMPKIISAESESLATPKSSVNCTRSRNSIESESNSQPADGAANTLSPDHYYLERRLLEINEKMLKEKTKQNKILRKRNKILQQTRKDQKKLTEAVNKLVDHFVRRGNSF